MRQHKHPYRYALNERKRPRHPNFSCQITETKKYDRPPALQTTKNFLLTTKNDSAIFSCKQRTNAMNRTKHHKLHAFQRAVGWCETVCNLCCYPLRAVYRKLLKRVSITGFPVIENLIADSDIKDRTERSPQAANKVVSRKFQTFVFRCMKSTLEDGVFFYCRFRIIQYSSFEQREWRNSYEWISNCINWYCCTRCRLSSVWSMARQKMGA